MASWQKRARIGVAVFGLVFAGIVYSAIRERPASGPPQPVRRADPKAISETYSAVLKQLSGAERPYDITFERAQRYDDGSTRLFGVRVTVRNRGGRDFVITADEASAADGETRLRLVGAVKVVASDGFELTTEEATFDQNTGIAAATGSVSFRKGRMSGSGVGMTYDQPNDILRFEANARVLATDDEGNTALEFTAGASTLDRPRNILSLEKTVHVVRGDEVIDAETIVARLTESDDIVTYLELRGAARVAGGVFDSMSARDIDLDYTDDGETLERVVLDGSASIAMPGAAGSAGRRMSGGLLDLRLASDGALTSAVGRSDVRVDLPAADGTPSRSIQSEVFDATGEPGQGLTSATFTSAACARSARDSCVVYREDSGGPPGQGREARGREARSRRLVVSLAGDAVTGATFTGSVTFTEQGLSASAADAIYEPRQGTLGLTGGDGGGRARVEEAQIAIDGRTIDVDLASRRMTAKGEVETEIRAAAAASAGDGPRMPRLLKGSGSVQISADTLEYAGSGGRAVYTGNAILSQGAATTIRGQTIVLDRKTGDLIATGRAISRLMLDDGNAVGEAHEIRYDDARRTIAYSPAAVGPTNGTGAPLVHLNVPDGDVTARRIDVVLAEGSAIERLEAYGDVSVTIGDRRATGARLTFHAREGRYVMNSAPGVPLRIVDRSSESCTETTGSTLILFKGTDRMTVDGKEFMRTQTKGGGPCGPLPLSR